MQRALLLPAGEPTEKEEVPQVKILEDKKSRNLGMLSPPRRISICSCSRERADVTLVVVAGDDVVCGWCFSQKF